MCFNKYASFFQRFFVNSCPIFKQINFKGHEKYPSMAVFLKNLPKKDSNQMKTIKLKDNIMKDYTVPWHVQYEDNHWPLEESEQQPCPFQHQGGQQIFPHL